MCACTIVSIVYFALVCVCARVTCVLYHYFGLCVLVVCSIIISAMCTTTSVRKIFVVYYTFVVLDTMFQQLHNMVVIVLRQGVVLFI